MARDVGRVEETALKTGFLVDAGTEQLRNIRDRSEPGPVVEQVDQQGESDRCRQTDEVAEVDAPPGAPPRGGPHGRPRVSRMPSVRAAATTVCAKYQVLPTALRCQRIVPKAPSAPSQR